MKKQISKTWEERFDKKFVKTIQGFDCVAADPKPIRAFISHLLDNQREEIEETIPCCGHECCCNYQADKLIKTK